MDNNICITAEQWQFQKDKLCADLHSPSLYNLVLLSFFCLTISMAAQVSSDQDLGQKKYIVLFCKANFDSHLLQQKLLMKTAARTQAK